MRLDATDLPLLLKGMEDALTPFSLPTVLASGVAGFNVYMVTAAFAPFPNQVLSVAQHFQGRNEIEFLVAALRDAFPRVPEFLMLADKVGFTQLPHHTALEVLIRKVGQPYADIEDFRATLAARENAVCRVETREGFGTGVLVGSNLVLTNYHVVAESMDHEGNLTGGMECRFDYKKTAELNVSNGRLVRVATICAFSPYAESDLLGEADNQDQTKLDYVLLRLEEKIAELPLVDGGEKRGFIAIDRPVSTLGINDGLIILQHPAAKPMKVDLGAVTWKGATRLRHSVNTEGGSSGSPVFDASLKLAALHHAGYDWPRQDYPYNQAVLIELIAVDAGRQGIQL